MHARTEFAAFLEFLFFLASVRVSCGKYSHVCRNNSLTLVEECIAPVASLYDIIVAQIINGNETGVDNLCRCYDDMEICLDDVASACAGNAFVLERISISKSEHSGTVGRYCKYYKEENMYNSNLPNTPPRSQGSTSSTHKSTNALLLPFASAFLILTYALE